MWRVWGVAWSLFKAYKLRAIRRIACQNGRERANVSTFTCGGEGGFKSPSGRSIVVALQRSSTLTCQSYILFYVGRPTRSTCTRRGHRLPPSREDPCRSLTGTCERINRLSTAFNDAPASSRPRRSHRSCEVLAGVAKYSNERDRSQKRNVGDALRG